MSVPPENGNDGAAPGPGAAETAATAAIAVSNQNRRRLTLLLSAIVAILAVILAFTVAKIISEKSDDLPTITLTSAGEEGPDPFYSAKDSLAEETANLSFKLDGKTAADRGVRAVNGDEPGLYAVYNSPSCDVSALSNHLMAPQNRAQAQAWASVFGITVDAIPYYLNTLSPVVLTTDTWVTNHSYTDGRAVPFQAILQAGTSVLVDGNGVPRVRCACGNPLAPPAAQPIKNYRTTGNTWKGQSNSTTTRVCYGNQRVNTSGTEAKLEDVSASTKPEEDPEATEDKTDDNDNAATALLVQRVSADTDADPVIEPLAVGGEIADLGEPTPEIRQQLRTALVNEPVAGNGDEASATATTTTSTGTSSEESSATSSATSEEREDEAPNDEGAPAPTALYGETADGSGVVESFTVTDEDGTVATYTVTDGQAVSPGRDTLILTASQLTEAGIKSGIRDGVVTLETNAGPIALTSITFAAPPVEAPPAQEPVEEPAPETPEEAESEAPSSEASSESVQPENGESSPGEAQPVA